MSRCFDINCHDCKKSLWIGQRDRIYGTEESVGKLGKFLFKHEGHRLSFDYDEVYEYEDVDNG